MGARKLDPTRLDVAALAAEGASLSGQWAASDLRSLGARCKHRRPVPRPRLCIGVCAASSATAVGAAPQIWLHLHASTTAWPTCQRCLRPFSQDLVVDRALRFVDGEAQAEALDADSEEDVLALEPALDLRTLAEDELLLAWPIVPRHASCAAPGHRAGDDGGPSANPFAALASLKPPAAGG